jgi:hypothetical protein
MSSIKDADPAARSSARKFYWVMSNRPSCQAAMRELMDGVDASNKKHLQTEWTNRSPELEECLRLMSTQIIGWESNGGEVSNAFEELIDDDVNIVEEGDDHGQYEADKFEQDMDDDLDYLEELPNSQTQDVYTKSLTPIERVISTSSDNNTLKNNGSEVTKAPLELSASGVYTVSSLSARLLGSASRRVINNSQTNNTPAYSSEPLSFDDDNSQSAGLSVNLRRLSSAPTAVGGSKPLARLGMGGGARRLSVMPKSHSTGLNQDYQSESSINIEGDIPLSKSIRSKRFVFRLKLTIMYLTFLLFLLSARGSQDADHGKGSDGRQTENIIPTNSKGPQRIIPKSLENTARSATATVSNESSTGKDSMV